MFTPNTLSLLKSLKRNNERQWFHARRDQYDAHCRAPMLAIVERPAGDLRSFAPEMVADPKVSMFRPFRDGTSTRTWCGRSRRWRRWCGS